MIRDERAVRTRIAKANEVFRETLDQIAAERGIAAGPFLRLVESEIGQQPIYTNWVFQTWTRSAA